MSPCPVVLAVRLDTLATCNPGLTLADILALWHLPCPSARLH